MKSFTECPVCKESLLNTSMRIKSSRDVWLKMCMRRLGHTMTCTTQAGNDDELSTLSFVLNADKQLKVTWFFEDRTLFIHKGNVSQAKRLGYMIPFFEPDLSNYKKMMDKVKTYIIFS
jgi:hypothetical protein